MTRDEIAREIERLQSLKKELDEANMTLAQRTENKSMSDFGYMQVILSIRCDALNADYEALERTKITEAYEGSRRSKEEFISLFEASELSYNDINALQRYIWTRLKECKAAGKKFVQPTENTVNSAPRVREQALSVAREKDATTEKGERFQYFISLVSAAKYTRAQIIEMYAEKYGAKKASVSTMISDSQNPKYNKCPKILQISGAGIVSF